MTTHSLMRAAGQLFTGKPRVITPEFRDLTPRDQLALFFRAGFKSNGCRWERRLYKRLWQRVRRLDRKFLRKEARDTRDRRRKDPELRKSVALLRARWAKKHRRKLAADSRQWYAENRLLRCFFCGQPRSKGRYILHRVKRMVIVEDKLVRATVLWCGCLEDPMEKAA